MSFAAPEYLLLLLLVPVAAYWFSRLETRRRNTALEYADAGLQSTALTSAPRTHSTWPRVLQLIALTALLFTASRPSGTLNLPQNKAAVIIALDTSRSMLAPDAAPTRFDLAKKIAKDFAQLAPKDTKIGLVTFSESAAAIVPVTTDREQLLERLEKAKVANTTSLADPIVTGVKALPERKDVEIPPELTGIRRPQNAPNPNAKPVDPAKLPPGAILLISDGVGNSNRNPQLAARFAKEYKVKIYTIAVGKEGGTVAKVEGRDYFIPYNAQSLKDLAQLGEGQFVTPEKENLEKVFKELGTTIRWEPTKLELSGPLAGLAMLLLVGSSALNLRWHRRLV
jgi:Ca-activated chloride channel homolog